MAVKFRNARKLIEELSGRKYSKLDIDAMTAGYVFPDFEDCTEEQKEKFKKEDESCYITAETKELNGVRLTFGRLGCEDRKETRFKFVPRGSDVYMIELAVYGMTAEVTFYDDIREEQADYLRAAFDRFSVKTGDDEIKINKKDTDTFTDLFSRIKDGALPQIGNEKTWLRHHPEIYSLIRVGERINRHYAIEERSRNCDKAEAEKKRKSELDALAYKISIKLKDIAD